MLVRNMNWSKSIDFRRFEFAEKMVSFKSEKGLNEIVLIKWFWQNLAIWAICGFSHRCTNCVSFTNFAFFIVVSGLQEKPQSAQIARITWLVQSHSVLHQIQTRSFVDNVELWCNRVVESKTPVNLSKFSLRNRMGNPNHKFLEISNTVNCLQIIVV